MIIILVNTMIKTFRVLGRFLSHLHLIITIIIALAIVLTITIPLAFQAREDPFMKHQIGERTITISINNSLLLINNLLITITTVLIKILILIIILVI